MAGEVGLEPYVQIWCDVLESEPDPTQALVLLADAIAFGLNTGDWYHGPIFERILESFDVLHIAKHVGRRH